MEFAREKDLRKVPLALSKREEVGLQPGVGHSLVQEGGFGERGRGPGRSEWRVS